MNLDLGITFTIDFFYHWYLLGNLHKMEQSYYKFSIERLSKRRRTQGPDESLGIYLLVMDNLFCRLTVASFPDVRLRLILKNVVPFCQKRLSLVDITSKGKLLELDSQLVL